MRDSRNGEIQSKREGICLFWKKLLNSPEGKSAGGFSVKQVNKPKLLIEAADQETASRD